LIDCASFLFSVSSKQIKIEKSEKVKKNREREREGGIEREKKLNNQK
jgi:hypothetical protein